MQPFRGKDYNYYETGGKSRIEFREDILKKFLIVFIWIIIALGIYQCSINLNKTQEEIAKVQEPEQKQEPKPEFVPEESTEQLEQKPPEEIIIPPFDENIRVLIMTEGFKGIYHTELTISCSKGICVDIDGHITEYEPNFEYVVKQAQMQIGKCIKINGKNGGRLKIGNVTRNGDGIYRGKFEFYSTKDGIVAVNELLVEEYLYGVVPSEMPSNYPTEALKAQAICARTYTYFHKQSYAYPEWKAHMDDSTSFQVYMNFGETEAACKAVDETKNMILTYQDELVESFYYSTSSGLNGGAGVWKDFAVESDQYLIETGEDIFAENSEDAEAAYKTYIDNGNPADVEYKEPWYRWDYEKTLDSGGTRKFLEKLYNLSLSYPQNVRIRSRYLPSSQIKEENGIRDIRILTRKKSGLITKIMIETEHFRISISTQHTIRQAFGCEGDIVIKNDGSRYTMGDILPSAYFYIEKIYDNNGETGDNLKQVMIHGAGLGHGCGMSQNGAKCLAERGFTAAQVLAYYYNGNIIDVSELIAGIR